MSRWPKTATINLSIWVGVQIFEQSCPKAGDANPLVAKPETNFNAKWPFKVIYFGIIEEPLRGYIAQYNKCGLRCKGSEDTASKKSENRHFRPPTLIWPIRIFGWKLAQKNCRDGATVLWKLCDPNFSRFWMIHPCDRQTDRWMELP